MIDNVWKGATASLVGITMMMAPDAGDAATLYASENIGNIVTYDTSAGSSGAISLSRTVLVSGINNPNGITTDRTGNIYVAATGANEVIVYRPDGTELRRFGSSDNLAQPADVAVDTAGNAYVVNGNGTTNAISKFDSTGNFVKYLPVANWSAGFYIDIAKDGTLYASGAIFGDSVLARFNSEMFLDSRFLLAASGVAINGSNGNINVAQSYPTGQSFIQVVDPADFFGSTTQLEPGVSYLNRTLGLETDQSGNIFAANFGEKAGTGGARTISNIGPNGTPIIDWTVENADTWARDLALAPVPLPASFLLLLGAMGSVTALRKRR